MNTPYIVSARKYRPSTFSSVVGQKALTATLRNAIATDRLAHAYLFCGSRGVGKTSCARIFAKTINCEHPTPEGDPCNECASCRQFNEGRSLNILELDAASNNSVNDIRTLTEQVLVPPTEGRYRVFIIDEVHMLSQAAFNAFLKTLEEPPSYVIFILATTEKHKIIPTILSRCQIYDFNRITIADIIDHLEYVAAQEGITAERSALNVIARMSDGAMRDALSIFDQVAASSRGNITYQSAIENLNVLDERYFSRLLAAFRSGNVPEALLVYKEVREHGFDSQFFITGLAQYLRDVMMARNPATLSLLDADDTVKEEMVRQAADFPPEFFYAAMSLCNEADLNYRQASSKTFLVELLLIRLCQLQSPSPTYDGAGEGHLKPITPVAPDAVTNAPAQQPAVAPHVSPTPQPAPISQNTQNAQNIPNIPKSPSSNAPTRGKRHFSIFNSDSGKQQDAQGEVKEIDPATLRSEPFTHEQLLEQWEKLMHLDPAAHVLNNTLRAHLPQPTERPEIFKVTVLNQAQESVLADSKPQLLAALRNGLRNDHLDFTVTVDPKAETPAMAWNDRKILEHLVDKHPNLVNFIGELGLTLD